MCRFLQRQDLFFFFLLTYHCVCTAKAELQCVIELGYETFRNHPVHSLNYIADQRREAERLIQVENLDFHYF